MHNALVLGVGWTGTGYMCWKQFLFWGSFEIGHVCHYRVVRVFQVFGIGLDVGCLF